MVEPLRVLVAHNYYRLRGGEDAVAEAEVALLRKHGHDVEFLVRSNADLDESRRVRSVSDAIWSSTSYRAINDAIRRFRPNVLHTHNTFPVLSPAVIHAAARNGVPVVQTLHNFRLMCVQAMFLRDGKVCEDCLGRIPWRGVVRKCYRGSLAASAALASSLVTHRVLGTYRHRVARFIALNAFCKEKFVEGGLPEERIAIKPNFVEVPTLRDEPRQRGLFVGRLSPEKGVATLAGAMGLLSEAQVDVLGEGPEQDRLRNIPRLTLLGSAGPQEVHARMSRAAYLVLPSIWYENFPRTLVEAYGAGLPVIASRIGALKEIVEEGRTGLLFEPGSASDLAGKMAWADANPGEMRRMGSNARQEYEQRYSPDINYRQLTAIYEAAARYLSPAGP
ncbi:MAG: glycosyltransferase [Betaproteobacteria bacterium]